MKYMHHKYEFPGPRRKIFHRIIYWGNTPHFFVYMALLINIDLKNSNLTLYTKQSATATFCTFL